MSRMTHQTQIYQRKSGKSATRCSFFSSRYLRYWYLLVTASHVIQLDKHREKNILRLNY